MKKLDRNKETMKNKFTKKQKIILLCTLIFVFCICGIVGGTYIYKANGNIADAAINIMADIVGDDNPIFVLVLGVSVDIDTPLTDTIMLVRI